MYTNLFNPDHYSEHELALLRKLLCFDDELYLKHNPDLSEVTDLLRHFLKNGMYEQRYPWTVSGISQHATEIATDIFGEPMTLLELIGYDAAYYLANYPDVEQFPGPALQHFLIHGMQERRRPFDFAEHAAAEELTWSVLTKSGLPKLATLDQQLSFTFKDPTQYVQSLFLIARRARIKPKAYRNTYWAALAMGFAALGFFGAATVCYNYFYNYMLPMPQLGNWHENAYICGKLSNAVNYVKTQGGYCRGLLNAEPVVVPEPVFLNRPNQVAQESVFHQAEVCYCQISQVKVFGLNSLIQVDSHTFLYEHFDAGDSKRPAEIKSPNLVHWINQDVCLFTYVHSPLKIAEAYSLLHDHGHNYFHWLIEVLPRYLLAREHGLLLGVPVLIDEKLSPLLNKLLLRIVGDSSLLIRVPRGQSVEVEKLHWVSELSKNTVHTNDLPLKDDILLSSKAFELLRSAFAELFRDGVSKYEKVLINRSNVSFRRLVNRHILREFLEQQGYWSVDTGAIDFEEQVKVFSNARVIIAEAGAALANLVFCRPGTTVIVLVNGYEASNYYYLAQMAFSLKLDLRFFECYRLVGSHKLGVHDDMIVAVSALREYIAELA